VRDDALFLRHILDAIDRVFEYTAEGEDTFLTDRKTQDAVIRNLAVLGEAVKNLSGELRQAHDDVPWKRIAGMRDKVIHAYFGIDLQLVHEVIRQSLPPLRQRVEEILTESETRGESAASHD